MLKTLLLLPFDLLGCLLMPSWYKKELDMMDIDKITGSGDYYD